MRAARLSVSSRKNYEPGVATCGSVLSLCVCLQSSAPFGGIPHRPDPSGARGAHIGKHETFLAGVLARGQELTTRLPTCHLVCQPFSSGGPCFEPGRWPRASRGQAPALAWPSSSLCLSCVSLAGLGEEGYVVAGFAGAWPRSLLSTLSSLVLRCRTRPRRGFLTLGLVSSHDA